MLNNNFPKKKKHFWILNKYIIILPEIVLILYFVFILILYILFQIHVQPKLHLNLFFDFRDYDWKQRTPWKQDKDTLYDNIVIDCV
jgi:hypothetical protein